MINLMALISLIIGLASLVYFGSKSIGSKSEEDN
jgi:hypothetical protein